MPHVSVRELSEAKGFDLGLALVGAPQGLENKVTDPHLQKVGLGISGYTSFVNKNRVQVFGKTEISYLENQAAIEQERICQQYFDLNVVCCVVTRNLDIPAVFRRHAERTNTPVLRTELPTQTLMERLSKFLDGRFAQTTNIHGVLLDVFGVGVLILGESGIGKSECALDLILRGHRLVSDDVVELAHGGPLAVYGRGPEVTKYHMEIRGLGIINVKEMFGISAIRDRKKLQLVVKLVIWENDVEYDRIGLEEHTYRILGVDLPLIVLPVRPGRTLSTIVEVAARNHLLKLEGFHAAKEFQQKLLAKLTADAESQAEEPE